MIWPVGVAVCFVVAQQVIVAWSGVGRWGDAGIAVLAGIIGIGVTALCDWRALKSSLAMFR
jgi:hypothetical protein